MMTSQVMTVDEIRKSRQPAERTNVGLCDSDAFALAQRAGRLLADSQLVPPDYKNNLPNCVIALNMAARIGADPLMVMQNLVLVHNRPTWSSQFLIATFNACGRFSALRYEFKGTEGQDDWSCRAFATEKSTGEVIYGSWISIALAKSEGWYNKNGSKWKSMPQQMLMYRSAAWLVRAYAPELAMGLHTAEEVRDSQEVDVTPTASQVDAVVEKAEQAAKEPRNVKRRAPKEAKTVVEEVAQSMPDVSVAAIRQEIEKAQDIDSLNSIFGSRVEPFTGRMTEKQREDLNAAYEAAEYRIQNTAEQEPEPEYVEQPRQQPRQQQRQAQQQPDDHFDFE